MYVFFSENRPPEESDNKRSSTRRGEFDSSRLSWEFILVIVEFYSHRLHRVELFEEKSILVFPECLEASE